MKKIYLILSVLCAAFVAVSCSNDSESTQAMGYLKLELNTLVSTHTRTAVPTGYDARKLHVSIIDANDQTVAESDWADGSFTNADFGSALMLTPGTYTVEAHSANWDGSDSGFDAPFYAGSTSVTLKAGTLSTAKITCTQENVKVTVIWDESFPANFTEAFVAVSTSDRSVASRRMYMDEGQKSVFFPVGALSFALTATNKKGTTNTMTNNFSDVNARDHFIITYKVAEAGTAESVDVYIDESTQTYTYTINVNREPGISIDAKSAAAWAKFANLSGEVTANEYDATKLTLQWKLKNADTWTDVPASALTRSGDKFTYKLANLTPETAYTYRFAYNDGENEATSQEVNFTTDKAEGIYNNGFENWYSVGRIDYCGVQSDGKYWNSSNGGAATYVGSVTTQDNSFKHGGSSSAKLASKYAVVKFAAASLFTGDFIGLIGTKGAKLDWGVPFTSRPSALKGYYSYTSGSINRGTQPSGVGAPASGSNDECQIQCALVTEQFHVANAEADGYEMTTTIDWQNDPRVVAYGQMTRNTSTNGEWVEFNIPLTYHSATKKPTHMIIVCAASKWGDYFYGSDSSVMHLDDFEFVYDDNPTIR